MIKSRLEIDDRGYKEIVLGASSKGNQSKYSNGNIWVKTNYLGYEDLAEYVASLLLECSNLTRDSFVQYGLCTFRGEMGCFSSNMLSSGESLVTLTTILRVNGISQSDLDRIQVVQKRIDTVIEVVKSYTGIDITEYLSNLLSLDAIILNEDRHLSNIALIYNSSSDKYRLAPIYDNGAGFMSDITQDYRLDVGIAINIRKVKAKPFSSSFKNQYKCLTPTIRFDRKKVEEIICELDSYEDDDNVLIYKRISYVLKCSMKNYKELFVESPVNISNSEFENSNALIAKVKGF